MIIDIAARKWNEKVLGSGKTPKVEDREEGTQDEIGGEMLTQTGF